MALQGKRDEAENVESGCGDASCARCRWIAERQVEERTVSDGGLNLYDPFIAIFIFVVDE